MVYTIVMPIAAGLKFTSTSVHNKQKDVVCRDVVAEILPKKSVNLLYKIETYATSVHNKREDVVTEMLLICYAGLRFTSTSVHNKREDVVAEMLPKKVLICYAGLRFTPTLVHNKREDVVAEMLLQKNVNLLYRIEIYVHIGTQQTKRCCCKLQSQVSNSTERTCGDFFAEYKRKMSTTEGRSQAATAFEWRVLVLLHEQKYNSNINTSKSTTPTANTSKSTTLTN